MVAEIYALEIYQKAILIKFQTGLQTDFKLHKLNKNLKINFTIATYRKSKMLQLNTPISLINHKGIDEIFDRRNNQT